jgi:hypothetical protein
VKISQSFLSLRTWLLVGVCVGVLVKVGVVVTVGVKVGVAVFVGDTVGVCVGVGVGQETEAALNNLVTPLDGLV